MLRSIISALHWRAAKAAKGKNPGRYASHIRKAVQYWPDNSPKLRKAVASLVDAKLYEDASEISSSRLATDTSGYWSHYATFVDELMSQSLRDGAPAIALFNDTDFRTNIGCRLTSQGLKQTILKTFPDAGIRSVGLRFASLRMDFQTPITAEMHSLSDLKERLAAAYGDEAFSIIEASDLVLLQPEGSLDHRTSLQGLATFFAPILVARMLGKPIAILNGTIPIYDDARDVYLRSVFERVQFVAARDELSASHHGIKFLADAAFLRISSPPLRENRDGCLITTGARNDHDQDLAIMRRALATCNDLNLRPIVLTHAVERLADFESDVLSRGGIFAETASIEKAAETLSTCALHIGARYHMTIFSIVCRVPTLLFDVKTHKNQWLAVYSPLVRLVGHDGSLTAEAREIIATAPKDWPPVVSGYHEFLSQAFNMGADQTTVGR
jgi:polysaccharide pyruvyl transferase WcaK-like protein